MSKQILIEFLDFLKFKVENDLLTMEDVESISKMIESGMPISGTIEDFSNFYGQPRSNVRSLISRRMVEKPVRKVYYPFNALLRIVPNSWLVKRNVKTYHEE